MLQSLFLFWVHISLMTAQYFSKANHKVLDSSNKTKLTQDTILREFRFFWNNERHHNLMKDIIICFEIYWPLGWSVLMNCKINHATLRYGAKVRCAILSYFKIVIFSNNKICLLNSTAQFRWKWARLAGLFIRQLLNGSHDRFHISAWFFLIKKINKTLMPTHFHDLFLVV